MSVLHFCEYDGGETFSFQQKIFYRDKFLGSGSFAEVWRFATKDKKHYYAVKYELAVTPGFHHGNDFQQEAAQYQKIYGLGVLSGNPRNINTPRYILMPYFPGELLHNKIYRSAKELFYYWMWTAAAVARLHTTHNTIHADLKSDNVIAGDNQIFLIDFGMTVKIGAPRKYHLYPEDRFFVRHQPAELFDCASIKMTALISQDVYCLGYLLQILFQIFLNLHLNAAPALLETKKNVQLITQNMTHRIPQQRWSIEKSMCALSSACLSQLPKALWQHMVLKNALDTTQMIFTIAIGLRMEELAREHAHAPSPTKEKKMLGLKRLTQALITTPADALITLTAAKKDRALTAGIFSRRTEKLLTELQEIEQTLRLVC